MGIRFVIGFPYSAGGSMATPWHAFGGFNDASETISISGASAWTHVTNAGNNLWSGDEATGITISGDVMTIENGGDYIGVLAITFHAGVNKDFKFRVYNVTQATQEGFNVGATGFGAANLVNVALPLYFDDINSNDQLRVEVECTTDGSDPTLTDAAFYVAYLHA